jgi:hypothetical protein
MKTDFLVQKITQSIYSVRGEQIMLANDLATLFEISNKRLNEQVKRNIDRSPPDFRFRLLRTEYDLLSTKGVISKTAHRKHRKYLPLVFINRLQS